MALRTASEESDRGPNHTHRQTQTQTQPQTQTQTQTQRQRDRETKRLTVEPERGCDAAEVIEVLDWVHCSHATQPLRERERQRE